VKNVCTLCSSVLIVDNRRPVGIYPSLSSFFVLTTFSPRSCACDWGRGPNQGWLYCADVLPPLSAYADPSEVLPFLKLFAVAELWHIDRLGNCQPVGLIRNRDQLMRPLVGSLNTTFHIIRDNTQKYVAVFPDLSVRLEGHYYLKFHLYEIVDGHCLRRTVAKSNTFRVYNAKDFPGMSETTPLNATLKQFGIRVRVARSIRAKKVFLQDVLFYCATQLIDSKSIPGIQHLSKIQRNLSTKWYYRHLTMLTTLGGSCPTERW
jgi:Velvet factor